MECPRAVVHVLWLLLRVALTVTACLFWICACYYLLGLGAVSLVDDGGVVFPKGAAFYVVPIIAVLLLCGAVGLLALLHCLWGVFSPPSLFLEQYNNRTTSNEERMSCSIQLLVVQTIARLLLQWLVFVLFMSYFVVWMSDWLQCVQRDVLICGSILSWSILSALVLGVSYWIFKKSSDRIGLDYLRVEVDDQQTVAS